MEAINQTTSQIISQLQKEKKTTPGAIGSQGKVKFKQIFQMEANKLVQRNNSAKKFTIDSSNIEVINALLAYFTGQQVSGIELTKGILLSGPVGVGKSLMLKAFANTLRHYQKAFSFVACQDIVFEYETTGQMDKYTANQAGYSGKPAKFCFDEIGRETIPAVHFGNRRNVMQHILAYRYNYWQNNGLITHGTTNATPQELVSLYGEHIGDRIREMFNWIPVDGNSRR